MQTVTSSLQSTKFVQCPICQADILILSNVKAMKHAFREHALLHSSKNYKLTKILSNLNQQLLNQILKTERTTTGPQIFLLIESYFGLKRTLGVALSVEDAEQWVLTQYSQNPQGSYFYEKGKVYTGGA